MIAPGKGIQERLGFWIPCHGFQGLGLWIPVVSGIPGSNILGDPGADSGDEGKFKRAEKYGRSQNGGDRLELVW